MLLFLAEGFFIQFFFQETEAFSVIIFFTDGFSKLLRIFLLCLSQILLFYCSYEKLFEPKKWDVIIRILSPPGRPYHRGDTSSEAPSASDTESLASSREGGRR